MVLRNSFYNMLGLGLPLLVAVVAIPELIHALGAGKFGILTIIWAVVSYFGLFDLGLGRAVTQQVAVAVGAGDKERIGAIVGTSSLLMLVLGLVAALVMGVAAPWMSRKFATGSDIAEVTRAFFWMALAMPSIVLTSGYRGILEAMERFALVNAIRFPMGVFTFAGPLVAVWAGYARLDVIAAVLCLGRIAACAAHGHYALRSISGLRGHGTLDRAQIRPLLSLGGWISVSNIISPLMNYIDRFLIGIMLSASAVAYYATPQELVLRLGIIPSAVVIVLFPIFARSAGSGGDGGAAHLRRYSLLILAMMLPLTLALVLFAEPLLALWISPEFASHSAAILRIIAVAALASGLAQVPFTMLQGQGRADITAKLHIVEFPLYLGLLYLLVLHYGAIGAAWAWLIRIVLDFGALWIMASMQVQSRARSSGNRNLT